MDERKKIIRDVEDKKQLEQDNNNQLEESLGKVLLERLTRAGGAIGVNGGVIDGAESDAAFLAANLEEHRRLLAEVADAEGQIVRIEADTQRLKDTEAAITQREGVKAAQTKALNERHTTLGERVLREPGLSEYSKPHQAQVSVLMIKAQELSDKLDHLNAAEEKSNLFARIGSQIGKGVQSLTLRSSLAKQRELIQKAYAVAGERFTLAANPTDNAALAAFAAETEEARDALDALNTELVGLQADRGRLNDVFQAEGNPVKHIQTLEKQLVRMRDEQRELYRKTGKEIADAAFAAAVSLEADSRDTLSKELNAADLAMLDQIALCREKIAHTEKEITSLKAAIVIDEEKAAIEKHNRSIEEQRNRIAASEAEIADLESRIKLANAHIEELTALLY